MTQDAAMMDRLREALGATYPSLKARYGWLDCTACVARDNSGFLFAPKLSCGCWTRVEMPQVSLDLAKMFEAFDGHVHAHRCGEVLS